MPTVPMVIARLASNFLIAIPLCRFMFDWYAPWALPRLHKLPVLAPPKRTTCRAGRCRLKGDGTLAPQVADINHLHYNESPQRRECKSWSALGVVRRTAALSSLLCIAIKGSTVRAAAAIMS